MTCHCLSLVVHARDRSDLNSKHNINIKTFTRLDAGPHETMKENKTKYSLVQWTNGIKVMN